VQGNGARTRGFVIWVARKSGRTLPIRNIVKGGPRLRPGSAPAS
jgi:hypothetical protein